MDIFWEGIGQQFTMRDLAAKKLDFELISLEGKKFSLSEELGKSPVLLIFIKHDCPTCHFILPFVERLYKRYGLNKAAFLIIAQDEEPDIRGFVKENEVSIPVMPDQRPYKVSRQFDLAVVPTVILLNRDGSEIQKFVGFQKAELEKLNFILAGLDRSPDSLFGRDDEVPEFKPG